MNIVFLDIDGVLNKYAGGSNFEERFGICDNFVCNLAYIIKSIPNTKVVISSSWRMIDKMDSISTDKLWIEVLSEKLAAQDCNDVIIGKIGFENEFPKFAGKPVDPDKGRGDDIAKWLDENGPRLKVRNFVILDDNVSYGNIPKMFPNNHVDCSKFVPYEGLSVRHAKTAAYILNGREKKMTERTWIISDTHFGHSNIIKYCNRPFKTAEEMDIMMIESWNSRIGKDDEVWHLGDFAVGCDKQKRVPELVSKLNGRINLVMGNHDTLPRKFYESAGFNAVYDHPIVLNGFIIMSHEPLQFLNENCPFFNCFGHVHDSNAYDVLSKTGFCACVERWNYAPVSFVQLKKMFKDKYGDFE